MHQPLKQSSIGPWCKQGIANIPPKRNLGAIFLLFFRCHFAHSRSELVLHQAHTKPPPHYATHAHACTHIMQARRLRTHPMHVCHARKPCILPHLTIPWELAIIRACACAHTRTRTCMHMHARAHVHTHTLTHAHMGRSACPATKAPCNRRRQQASLCAPRCCGPSLDAGHTCHSSTSNTTARTHATTLARARTHIHSWLP